jgi:N-acetylmuramoyl-L-alanine amidase
MAHKIYLSASTQQHNVGVSGYGTEEDNMFKLRELTIKYLNKGGYKFTIEKNNNESNKFKAEIHLAFHTNAGNSRGCEVYYSYLNKNGTGKKLATLWYNEISPITPSKDRGVKLDNSLYKSGFQELRTTNAVAALCEFIFHTSTADVKFFKDNIDKLALGTAKAIYKYFNIAYKTTATPSKVGKTVYRVIAGSYVIRANADAEVKRLKKDFNIDAFIEKKLI